MAARTAMTQAPAQTGESLVHVELMVEGMTCGSCAARVQRAVGNLAGVDEAGVNFATGRLNVQFDAALTGVAAFQAAVTKAGYVLNPVPGEQSGQLKRDAELERDHAESDEQRSWLVRTAVAWPLGLATMGLVFLVPGGNEDPALRWAQLALATPAQFYAGWPFLRGAARRARARSVNMDSLVSLGTLAAFI